MKVYLITIFIFAILITFSDLLALLLDYVERKRNEKQ